MKSIKDREKQKQQKKDLKQKLMLFDRLPDHCVACDEPFDRMNREQVLSWTVVVRTKEEKVNLYCPECITKAKAIIKTYEEKLKEGVNELVRSETEHTVETQESETNTKS